MGKETTIQTSAVEEQGRGIPVKFYKVTVPTDSRRCDIKSISRASLVTIGNERTVSYYLTLEFCVERTIQVAQILVL